MNLLFSSFYHTFLSAKKIDKTHEWNSWFSNAVIETCAVTFLFIAFPIIKLLMLIEEWFPKLGAFEIEVAHARDYFSTAGVLFVSVFIIWLIILKKLITKDRAKKVISAFEKNKIIFGENTSAIIFVISCISGPLLWNDQYIFILGIVFFLAFWNYKIGKQIKA